MSLSTLAHTRSHWEKPALKLVGGQGRETFAAPAERESEHVIRQQHTLFEKDPILGQVLDGVPGIVLVLNRYRQIVFTNREARNNLGEGGCLAGYRFGEALDCTDSREMDGGCGTGMNCRHCGALKAFLDAELHSEGEEEHCFLIDRNDGLELRRYKIRVTAFVYDKDIYYLMVLSDTAGNSRHNMLERVFLHDILNTAVALRGYMELVKSEATDPAEKKNFCRQVEFLANQIVEEITSHRSLLSGENDLLAEEFVEVGSMDFLQHLVNEYRQRKTTRGEIVIDSSSENIHFCTSRVILSRVLGNMIKNALEASGDDEQVVTGCRQAGNFVQFWVQNPAFLSESIRQQIFDDRYSTKGKHRGLGTCSIKYLTEHFLRGSVQLCSDEKEGTVFSVYLPVREEKR